MVNMEFVVGAFTIVSGLILALVNVSSKAAKLQAEVEELKTRVKEDKEHNDKRIAELYQSRNDLQNNMGILNNTMLHVVEVMNEIKDNLNDFMKEVRNCKE